MTMNSGSGFVTNEPSADTTGREQNAAPQNTSSLSEPDRANLEA